MTIEQHVAIITSLATLFAAVSGMFLALAAFRASMRTSAKIDQVGARVEEVHTATNGLTVRLEAAAKREGVAVGTAAGIEQGVRQEQDRR